MDPKFKVGDEVVVLWPNREVEAAVAKTMSKYIGKTFRVEAHYHNANTYNGPYPPDIYRLDWDRIPSTVYEDWLDYASASIIVDELQLVSLL